MKKELIKMKIEIILKNILETKEMDINSCDLNSSLYEDGIGLDSLDAATFSAMLEREFGKDPYNNSSGNFPRTIEDIVKFYTED